MPIPLLHRSPSPSPIASDNINIRFTLRLANPFKNCTHQPKDSTFEDKLEPTEPEIDVLQDLIDLIFSDGECEMSVRQQTTQELINITLSNPVHPGVNHVSENSGNTHSSETLSSAAMSNSQGNTFQGDFEEMNNPTDTWEGFAAKVLSNPAPSSTMPESGVSKTTSSAATSMENLKPKVLLPALGSFSIRSLKHKGTTRKLESADQKHHDEEGEYPKLLPVVLRRPVTKSAADNKNSSPRPATRTETSDVMSQAHSSDVRRLKNRLWVEDTNDLIEKVLQSFRLGDNGANVHDEDKEQGEAAPDGKKEE
ncbi:hypothetical protein MMC30_006660 [Trapelia coarctata]|nr:hypothetical protein [Trapelia coarctata]